MTVSAAVAKEINLPVFRTSTTTRLGMTQSKTFFVTPLNRHAAFFAVVFYPHFENYCLSFAQMCNENPATADKGTIKAYHADVMPSFATVSVDKSACIYKQPLVNVAPLKKVQWDRNQFLSQMDYESYQHFAAVQIMNLFLTTADGQITLKGTIM